MKSLILNRSMTLTLKSSFAVTGFIASSPELVAVNPAFGHSGLFCVLSCSSKGRWLFSAERACFPPAGEVMINSKINWVLKAHTCASYSILNLCFSSKKMFWIPAWVLLLTEAMPSSHFCPLLLVANISVPLPTASLPQDEGLSF